MKANDLHQAIVELNEEVYEALGDQHDNNNNIWFVAILGGYTEGIMLGDEFMWDSENDPAFDTVDELKTFVMNRTKEYSKNLMKVIKRFKDGKLLDV